MAKYPDSTKTSLEQRLRARARERWPQIASLQIRHRGNFSYVPQNRPLRPPQTAWWWTGVVTCSFPFWSRRMMAASSRSTR